MPNLDEREIIAKALTGNRMAFRELMECFQGFVYSIAFRFTGNSLEAEDLTQEAFVRVWKNLPKYNAQWEFKTWVGKIITNLSLDYLKSASRKRELKKTSIEESFGISDVTNPQKEIEASELNLIVARLAAGLTEKQQAVFILRDLELLDTEEVCAMLNLTADQVKSNLYHARMAMRIGLQNYYNTNRNEVPAK